MLMSPDANGPQVHYYVIRGGMDKTNVTVWEVGKVGEEYIKTYGHYHAGEISETYKILQGEGVFLLQKRKTGIDGNLLDDTLESFIAVKVKENDKVFIPSGYGHLVVNTGKTWLVTSDNSPVNFEKKDPVSLPGHAEYSAVKKMHGFGYYLVEEKGQVKLIKNGNYKDLPQPDWLTPQDWNQRNS